MDRLNPASWFPFFPKQLITGLVPRTPSEERSAGKWGLPAFTRAGNSDFAESPFCEIRPHFFSSFFARSLRARLDFPTLWTKAKSPTMENQHASLTPKDLGNNPIHSAIGCLAMLLSMCRSGETLHSEDENLVRAVIEDLRPLELERSPMLPIEQNTGNTAEDYLALFGPPLFEYCPGCNSRLQDVQCNHCGNVKTTEPHSGWCPALRLANASAADQYVRRLVWVLVQKIATLQKGDQQHG